MAIIRVPVSNSFDAATAVNSSNATLNKVAGVADTFEILASDGVTPLVDAGVIDFAWLISTGLISSPSFLLTRVGHNGDGSTTSWRVWVAVDDGAGVEVRMSPSLSTDPSTPTGGSVGPLAVPDQSCLLVLDSNGSGDQIAVFEAIPCKPLTLAELGGAVFGEAASSEDEYVTVPLLNTVSSGAAEYYLEWRGAAVEIVEAIGINNLAVAGTDLTVTLSIDGTPVTSGVVTVPVGAAGTSGAASPSGDNVLINGSKLLATIGGGNTTASSTGLLLLRLRPLSAS